MLELDNGEVNNSAKNIQPIHPESSISQKDMNEDLYDNDSSNDIPENENDGFTEINGKRARKRQLADSPQHERYVLDTNELRSRNKYFKLSMNNEHNYSSNQLSDDDNNMDETESPKKTKSIPPLFLKDVNNHQKIVSDIKTLVISSFSTEIRGQSLKVNLTTIDDYRKLTKFYDSNNIKYHTFKPIQDKNLEFIIRNVPCSLSDEEILDELTALDFPIIKVTRLYNKSKEPMPLCFVEAGDNEDGRELINLTRLNHSIVKVEIKKKSKSIPQCVRCQRFGHTKNYCKLDPRCVRCDGQHLYSDCPKPRDKETKPICVNCGEEHTANYRGCKYFQNILNKVKSSTRTYSDTKKSNPNENSTNDTANNNENNANSMDNQPNGATKTFASVTKMSKDTKQVDQTQTDQQEKIDNIFSLSLEGVINQIVKIITPILQNIFHQVISSLVKHG